MAARATTKAVLKFASSMASSWASVASATRVPPARRAPAAARGAPQAVVAGLRRRAAQPGPLPGRPLAVDARARRPGLRADAGDGAAPRPGAAARISRSALGGRDRAGVGRNALCT